MTTRRDAEALLPKATSFIGDTEVAGAAAPRTFVHPGDGATYAELPLAGPADVDAALTAARAAFPGWRALAPAARRDLLHRLAGVRRGRVRFVGLADRRLRRRALRRHLRRIERAGLHR